jgi:hypothetical protein
MGMVRGDQRGLNPGKVAVGLNVYRAMSRKVI